MTRLYGLEQIKAVVETLDLTECISRGFVAYSSGEAVIPPVGEMIFNDPPGEAHIKYGYIRGSDSYVVKIASGFHENHTLGLPSGSGLMLVFSRKTGYIETILNDEGYLTNVRTAVAGRICAKHLAPADISAIGVLGTGIQARMQVEYLAPLYGRPKVLVWGRTPEHVHAYVKEMKAKGFDVHPMPEPAAVARKCRLIVTTTSSREPLLHEKDIRPGTHITAIGSDTPDKRELDPNILKRADIVVADSISQCELRGEIPGALHAGVLEKGRIVELGRLIDTPGLVQRSEGRVSVADLTGVAVQDIQIATAVCRALQ